MASEVDIANLALAHLGEDPAITSLDAPPSGGAHSKKAAIFYPIARNAMQEMHDWGFNTRRARLAELDLDNISEGTTAVYQIPDAFAYAYAWPAGCIKPRRVLLPGESDDAKGQDFLVETLDDGTKVIFTNAEDAVLVYTQLVTDTTKFSPLFEIALSHLLASHLAGPIIKGREGRTVAAEHLKHAMLTIGQAAASDANARQQSAYSSAEPEAIAARR